VPTCSIVMETIRSSVSFLLFVAFLTSTSFAQAVEPTVPAYPPTVFENPAVVQRYQATITPEDLASQLYLLASDYFEGRETTARGQKLAALYLASQYRKLGLEPGGTVQTTDPFDPEAYFQPFTVYGQRMQGAALAVD